MIILGVSAFYHDSAVCILKNGEIVYAAQEERFTRVKHEKRFPISALERGLEEMGCRIEDIDHVAYYDKPLLTFDRLLETWLAFAPRGFPSFRAGLPHWIKEKLFLSREIEKGLSGRCRGTLHYFRHHYSHAASAFFPSPFSESALLVMDGVGEWSSTTIGMGKDHQINLLKEIRFPHSIGLLYSAFTGYLGFTVNSGEYKVMGLAPYGRPKYVDLIHKYLIDVRPDGSYWMNMAYFNYCVGLTMTNGAFHDLFGGLPRRATDPLTQRHMDLAASIQKVVEDIIVLLVRESRRLTGADFLSMAGGCALNCVANGLISREKIFKKIYIQPAAGDAGGSLGAALMVWHQLLGNPRRLGSNSDQMKGGYLGPSYSNGDLQNFVETNGYPSHRYSEEELPKVVAKLLDEGKIVGLFQGAMEFGPRALGARSIIADPRRPDMQAKLNLKIKFRESFRPFAPVILEEKRDDFFELEQESPYMLLVGPLKNARRHERDGHTQKKGFDLLKEDRSEVPAVTHVDFSARVQTLTKVRNGLLYQITKSFDERTGCPVLVNTSFNVRGEPIVNTPSEAYRCFMFTEMDALVLQDHILLREEQPKLIGAEEYRLKFKRQDESYD